MMFLQRGCLLSGTLGLMVLVAPLAGAQQANSQSRSGPGSAAAADQRSQQESPAYQRGYQQGMEDRRASAEPSPGYGNWKNDADRSAYRSGYRAGYCHDEKDRTGYYNGIYRSYGPPVLRNGYYGYNAPESYCANGSDKTPGPQGNAGWQGGNAEYGGGG
jgi:hypothetical protein